MLIISGHQALGAHPLSRRLQQTFAAVGIGVFDGVHYGHQALLQKVVNLARQHGQMALAYTFDPHPAQLFKPELAPPLIEPISVRLERLAAIGIECTIVEPFNRSFASNTARDYVQNILVRTLQAKHVVVGAGFVFGRKQQGDMAVLQEMAQTHRFTAHPVPHVRAEGIEVSSTKIRAFVQSGQVCGANVLLNRPFTLFGTVIHGARRGGSQLGFPTANMQADNALLPGPGVYAARAQGVFGSHNAVLNVGYNPTFGQATPLKIEAHLLDYSGPNFYDTPFTLQMIARLRDETRFDSVEALKAQIHTDIRAAHNLLLTSA